MKGKIRRALLMLISASVLLVSITTAWILKDVIEPYHFIQIDYKRDGSLTVMSQELTAELRRYDSKTGKYEAAANDEPIQLSGMVPNQMLPFRIRFYNKTGAVQSVSLSMTGIKPGSEKLRENMFVGLSAGAGYVDGLYTEVELPKERFICFSDDAVMKSKDGVSYYLQIYDSLFIPPTGDGYVELNCYFWLHRDVEIDLSNIEFKIEKLHIVF